MRFIAGILVAWSIIYLVLAAGSLFAYQRFGRQREPLFFAAFCAFLGAYNAAGVFLYLADSLQRAVVPGRIRMAAVVLAAAALLFLGISKAEISEKARRKIFLAFGSTVSVLAVVCLFGLSSDYSRPAIKYFDLGFLGEATFYQYRFSSFGFIVSAFSLAMATAGGALLGRSARGDPAARVFFNLGVVVMVAIAVNDVLLVNAMIHSFFLLEHGLFLMTLTVFFGLVREFELSRDQLRDRTRTLRQVSQRLDRAADETRKLRPMADLGRLSASLAHEIRNPLAVMFNVASSLKRRGPEDAGGEQFQSLVGMLQEETGKLARLVDDLLLFAQMGRASRQPVEVGPLVEEALADARERLPRQEGEDVETEVQEGTEPILGSENGLKRALSNLIINAVQSSGGRGHVRVFARGSDSDRYTVIIGVQDSAGGVPEQSINEIFKPFYSTRSTGPGLGLSIAKGIVEAHDGSLELENHAEQGATFWIRLPSARNPLYASGKSEPPNEE